MKTTIETLDDDRVKFSVEVDETEFDAEINKAFKKIAREVRMPGFRKGKVPRQVLEARFGAGIARGQAIEDSVPEFFLAAISEHEVDLISPPDYEITSGEEDGPLHFDATVQVRPVVEISGYDNLRVEIPAPEPTADEIDDQIKNFLGQFAELASVDRPAATEDTVTVDITTTYDGAELEGLTADDYSYRVGTGAPVAELDENLTGAKVGDILEFDAAHPDPDEDGELSFRILVKDVQENVLPDLDDEVVANATEFETAADFKDDLETRMRRSKIEQADSLWREKSAEALGRLVDVEPPEALVDGEVRNRVEDMARRLAQSGIQFDQYLQMMGQDIDTVLEQMREPAIESVKVDLGLRALAVAENLEATDADVDDEFSSLSEGTGASVEELKEQISTPNQLMLLRADITKRKAADWLLDNVEVVDESGNPIDTDALHEQLHDHDTADEEEE